MECVPNFSEGRDAAKSAAIRDAIAAVEGVRILRYEADPDHNRAVITYAGLPESVVEAAFRGISKAAALIDLREHRGVHPRIGAADVVPLVPLRGLELAECAEMAHGLGQRVWSELGVPVYFYEAAATAPERAPLENVRRGGFPTPKLLPDLGGPALHPSAGGCIIGARRLLIAFNVDLDTADVATAREIARKVRASAGGLRFLKAIGVKLDSRNQAQIAMNLTEFEQTGLFQVFETVRAEAAALGVSITNTEIIGLVPRKSLESVAANYLKIENFRSALVLENRLDEEFGG